MGPWTALLVAYLVGGVTFIPLLVAAVLFHAHRTFPYRDDAAAADSHADGDSIVQPGDDTTALDDHKAAAAAAKRERPPPDLDVAAGYFAVCREYTPMGINAKPIERSTPLGSTTVAPPSPSVYQTMYRSIFDRKPVPGPIENNSMSQRPKKAGNVFYVVLRHGHLMLFDDEEQLEVRHVISLAHHDISIYSGGDVTPEGELFIKRNALCLTRRAGGSEEMAPDARVSKPFYLFSENCSAKEDFYFALLKNQEQTFGFENDAPSAKQFDVKDIISLVQKLHSSEDHVHSRWVNAMLGRIFLAVHRTRDLENFVREKITKKISRVKKPSYLTNINIQKIDIGDAAPYFTNMKLKDLTVEGECVVEADVRYSGNCRIEVSATAKIDLGTRFKAREVNLVLAVVLKRIDGHMLFKIKAPPSNRLWFSFQTMPKMEMAIEPIVSSRQITYTLILRQIENRIKEVMAETLVQPFWDDTPFFKTEHKKWRGGIFEGDDAVQSDLDVPLSHASDTEEAPRTEEEEARLINETRPIEKTQSVPVIDQQPPPTGLFGRRLASKPSANPSAAASSTSLDAKATAATTSRSPNIIKNSTEPVVGTETAHADLFKPSTSPSDHATNLMAALHSRAQEASPVTTPVGSPEKSAPVSMSRRSSNSSKGINGDKKEDDESVTAPSRRNTVSSNGSMEMPVPQSPTTASATGSLGRNFFLRRENSNASTSTVSTGSDNTQKRNTLAAVTNAAAQARNWGWNAIQRQKDGRRAGEGPSQVDLSQPMGRGQPLPPPGMPLPGPTNGRTKIAAPAPVPVPKRKPVPPVPASASDHTPPEGSDGAKDRDKENHRLVPPPPLPPRRRRGASQEDDEPEVQNILVVAAPDDSQPDTPLTEDKPEYISKPEAEAESQSSSNQASTPRGEASQPATGASLSRQTSLKRKPIPIRNPKPVAVETETEQDVPVGTTPDSEAGSSKPGSIEETEDGKPLVAIPVSTTPPGLSIDEDDDFSGWLDNESDGLPDEEIKDILPTAVTGTVAS
ncbi:hypothetical protein K4F52_003406 [Lecanicillium sp. MT-2017a]|nr:hypothetical protein K4F52_003406 [Lecanicillium sp. MT-2017a]